MRRSLKSLKGVIGFGIFGLGFIGSELPEGGHIGDYIEQYYRGH